LCKGKFKGCLPLIQILWRLSLKFGTGKSKRP
jgi:hypothetical protein